jgi:hypothetical protein
MLPLRDGDAERMIAEIRGAARRALMPSGAGLPTIRKALPPAFTPSPI